VATDVGDSREIIGDTGVLVAPGDDEALASGLSAMLSKSDEERRALGEAARARIEARYSLSRIVDRYANLYESLVGSSIQRSASEHG
jgi:glycosyltransferase involved in cell wall biosynthesis